MVSEGTSLFDLPQLFCESYFYFVISGNRIVGYVHYSDLNKTVVKIPFFAMFQAAEKRFWDEIRHRITEEALRKIFPPGEVDKFVARKAKAERGNVDLGWTGVFSFPSILKIARFHGLTNLPDEDIKLLKEVRNKVAHSDQHLIPERREVESLARAHALFQRLLR